MVVVKLEGILEDGSGWFDLEECAWSRGYALKNRAYAMAWVYGSSSLSQLMEFYQ